MRGKRKRPTIFFQRTREDHRQSDEHWTVSKATLGKLLRNVVERIIQAFPSAEIHIIELN